MLVVVSGTSIVDNVFGVVSSFLFPFVDVLRGAPGGGEKRKKEN